jgi:hypothetical protein
MNPFRVGMKVYDNDWYLHHGMSHGEAAAMLADWGVTFVLAQSRLLPMPDTAVKSAVPEGLAARYAEYDDRKFRDALARRNILYVASCLMFFDPAALEADPDIGAVDADGKPMELTDWYIGIPPTMETHVARKIAAIEQAVRILEPDGIHLGFMRWPGFWELWMPHHRRRDFRDYSYDRHSLERFAVDTGYDVPVNDSRKAAEWIGRHAREDWIDWKCRVVVDVIGQVRAAARKIKPDISIVLNTIPFGAGDFDNAEEKVFGQRFEWLAPVVDVFEVMTYHQILKRPSSWIGDIANEVKSRTDRTTVCTLQAAPLYLNGLHAGEGRTATLSVEDFQDCIEAVEASEADGAVFFVWSDFLRQLLTDGDSRRVDIIRAATRL